MSKQVKGNAAAAQEETLPVTTNTEQIPGGAPVKNLYVRVETFDSTGHTVGSRIVDMYHYGTRNWMANHLWWATHNGNTVEVNVCSPEEIVGYLADAKLALAEKFNDAKAA